MIYRDGSNYGTKDFILIDNMGCVNSKNDINDLHPNIFRVMNVDEMYQAKCPGQIEITETELVLHQRSKPPTKWPLCSLRKYGFESDLFSFECGRRCPTGPGIYAFRCQRAEQIFNLLQHNIQVRNISDDVNMSGVFNEFPLPALINGTVAQRRTDSQVDGYLNPLHPNNTLTRFHQSRPESLSSASSVLSPVALSAPPITDEIMSEHNNNKSANSIEHSYTNTQAIEDLKTMQPSYINLNAAQAIENYENIQAMDNSLHLYMNFDPESKSDVPNTPDIDDTKHCYANIDVANTQKPIFKMLSSLDSNSSMLQIPTSPDTHKEVNYAELDLVPAKIDNVPPESPTKSKSYVTIDFHKTNALSQTVNPSIEIEEGSRKTRHSNSLSD